MLLPCLRRQIHEYAAPAVDGVVEAKTVVHAIVGRRPRGQPGCQLGDLSSVFVLSNILRLSL